QLIIASSDTRRRSSDLASGIITTVAGNGSQGFSGDGGPATGAGLGFPTGVGIDGAGNLFIADSVNNRIRRVDAVSSIITTVAGKIGRAFSRDGGHDSSA